MTHYGEPIFETINGLEFIRQGARHKIIEVIKSALSGEVKIVLVRVYSEDEYEEFSNYWGE